MRKTWLTAHLLFAMMCCACVSIRDVQKSSSQTMNNYRMETEIPLRISATQTIYSDLFVPKDTQNPPLLIIIHGNASFKEAHRLQAIHSANAGILTLTVQLPNEDHWLRNGKSINRLVRLLYGWPEMLPASFDAKKIILAGHSFGGSAIAVAAGLSAPIRGLIFLDPALYHPNVIKYIKRIRAPSVILGADKSVFRAKKRNAFYKYTNAPILEVSIQNSGHDDATYPSRVQLKTFGIDPTVSKYRQQIFSDMLVKTTTMFEESHSISSLRAFIKSSMNEQEQSNFLDLKYKPRFTL